MFFSNAADLVLIPSIAQGLPSLSQELYLNTAGCGKKKKKKILKKYRVRVFAHPYLEYVKSIQVNSKKANLLGNRH